MTKEEAFCVFLKFLGIHSFPFKSWVFKITLHLITVAADGNEPVQIKIHKSLRLWTFYVDLEESLGTLESTRAVYERILDLRIATPQIIINYAMLLEV